MNKDDPVIEAEPRLVDFVPELANAIPGGISFPELFDRALNMRDAWRAERNIDIGRVGWRELYKRAQAGANALRKELDETLAEAAEGYKYHELWIEAEQENNRLEAEIADLRAQRDAVGNHHSLVDVYYSALTFHALFRSYSPGFCPEYDRLTAALKAAEVAL